jgi:hypothetical protein
MFNPRDFISFLKHPTLTTEEYGAGNVISVFKLAGQAYLFYIVAGVICTIPVIVLHLQNFYLDATSYFLYPLLIITNILMGFIAGYLRVRYTNGLFACILLHMTINIIACLSRGL